MIVNYYQKEFKETFSGPHTYVVLDHKIINVTSVFCRKVFKTFNKT